MKSRKITYFKYFSLFFAMIVVVLVVGCSGPTPTAPIINSFSALPSTITVGDSSTLSWIVTDATSVTIDQIVGSVASTGTNAVSPATTTTYTLTATNAAGSVTAATTITVNPVAEAPIITSFLADPLTIAEGESSTLSWSVTDATSVTIDQTIGSVALVSTKAVSPTTTTTYTLTATNAAGSVTATTTVTVNPVATTYGSIDVNSTPTGAKVYLDGVDTGMATPFTFTNKEAGPYVIKLDAFPYKIWEETVTVIANEITYINPLLTFATQSTILLQPGPEGMDVGVETANPLANYGDLLFSGIGNSVSTIVRMYIKFDLSAVPTNARVVDVDLKLYQCDTLGSNNFTIGLYNVTSDWEESTINWNSQPTSSTDAEITNNITAGAVAWESWDIDTLVQSWLDGDISNYGMVLKDTEETSVNTIAYFWTSDYTVDPSKYPKLEIDYYIP